MIWKLKTIITNFRLNDLKVSSLKLFLHNFKLLNSLETRNLSLRNSLIIFVIFSTQINSFSSIDIYFTAKILKNKICSSGTFLYFRLQFSSLLENFSVNILEAFLYVAAENLKVVELPALSVFLHFNLNFDSDICEDTEIKSSTSSIH